MTRWTWVLVIAFLVSSCGGTYLIVSKLERMEVALVAISLGKNPFPPKVDINIKGTPVSSTATVTCPDGRTTTFTETANPGESAVDFGARFARDLAQFKIGFCGG